MAHSASNGGLMDTPVTGYLGAMPEPIVDDIRFEAGYDLVTPSKYTRPGSCRSAQNWEIDINGNGI